MIINKITLTNFKNFNGKHEFFFDKINLVDGANGTGKTSLILDSVLFALYGYTNKTLPNLLNRSLPKGSVYAVEIEMTINNDIYIINRSYPTKLSITKNGVLLSYSTIDTAQKAISNIIGGLDSFKQFRLMDGSNIGINILDMTAATLKKTLLNVNEAVFNKIREKLLSQKNTREIYNKKNINAAPLYPSEKRVKILSDGISLLRGEIVKLQSSISKLSSEINTIHYEIGSIEGLKRKYEQEAKEFDLLNVCPTCQQTIPEPSKMLVKHRAKSYTLENENKTNELRARKQEKNELYQMLNTQLVHYNKKLSKAQTSLANLNNRLKQKDYIYTDKDVLLYKECIQQLDKFYDYFLINKIKILEPMINQVISVVGFSIQFKLNAKNSFDVFLEKNGILYKYDDLSKGEKLILNIGFKLALLLERGESGLVIIDEELSSLDANNLELMYNFFNNIPFQLFSVVHRLLNPLSFVKVISL